MPGKPTDAYPLPEALWGDPYVPPEDLPDYVPPGHEPCLWFATEADRDRALKDLEALNHLRWDGKQTREQIWEAIARVCKWSTELDFEEGVDLVDAILEGDDGPKAT